MNSSLPIASLSLDLDNQWSYLKVHGDSGWESFPSYLDLLIPRVLEFLAERNLKITFFIVGQDAALKKNHAALRMLTAAGHEAGNHSFSHEPWFHHFGRERIESEIAFAEEHIGEVTGQRPLGYRGPGFSFSRTTLEVLEARGYQYDASTFPTFIGPFARFYYLRHSNLKGGDLEKRNMLFGSLMDGFRPLAPYRWRHGKGLVEIPVTTMPIVRMPIHLSYLLYLSSFSTSLALSYFRVALELCRIRRISPSLLLHPLDFLGPEDRIGLEFFPGMRLSKVQKLAFLHQTIAALATHFRVTSLLEHSRTMIGESGQALTDSHPRRYPILKSGL